MTLDWYNENDFRAYPIREDSLKIDVDGKLFPDDIISDIAVSVPRDLEDVHLSMVSITPTLVSVSVAASGSGILAVTLPRTDPYVPQVLTPIVEDVSGFVVFGQGLDSITGPVTYKFDETAAPLESRAVRVFDRIPVTSIRRIGSSGDLQDIVNLEVSNNMRVRLEDNTIYLSLAEDVREDFVGPCDAGSTLGGCGVPPIRAINGVTPNDDGIIYIAVADDSFMPDPLPDNEDTIGGMNVGDEM
jgi:hypothetical protein